MAEKQTRRRFTAEFKAEAVKRLLEGGKGLGEVATELGLSPGQLSGWRNEHLAAGSAEALAAAQGRAGRAAAAQAREQAARGGGRDPQEGRGFFRPGDRVSRFAFVAAERANHAVATLCRVVGASVSGFYAWLRAVPAVRARADAEAELRGHIGRIFAARRRAYGSRRVHAELRREGRRHSRRARRAADARDGPARTAGPPAAAADHRQPPRPAGGAEPARPELRRRPAGHGLAGRHQLPADGRGLAVPGRDRGPGHARDRRLEHGRPPPGRAVRGRAGDGPAAPPAGARPDPPQDSGVQGGLKRPSQHPSAPTAAPHQGPRLAFASRASCAAGR